MVPESLPGGPFRSTARDARTPLAKESQGKRPASALRSVFLAWIRISASVFCPRVKETIPSAGAENMVPPLGFSVAFPSPRDHEKPPSRGRPHTLPSRTVPSPESRGKPPDISREKEVDTAPSEYPAIPASPAMVSRSPFFMFPFRERRGTMDPSRVNAAFPAFRTPSLTERTSPRATRASSSRGTERNVPLPRTEKSFFPGEVRNDSTKSSPWGVFAEEPRITREGIFSASGKEMDRKRLSLEKRERKSED